MAGGLGLLRTNRFHLGLLQCTFNLLLMAANLGGALLRAGRSAEAEQVFRDDLARNPRNGRSLYGLRRSLEAQRRPADAAWVGREFDAAWAGADVRLDPREL